MDNIGFSFDTCSDDLYLKRGRSDSRLYTDREPSILTLTPLSIAILSSVVTASLHFSMSSAILSLPLSRVEKHRQAK